MLKKWDVEYFENFEISKISYVGIGGVARLYVLPSSKDTFINLLSYLYVSNLKFKVVGRMSNILFAGSNFDGVLIGTVKINGYSLTETEVDVDCGASMSYVIKSLAKLSLGGLEEIYSIPASLGGMIYSNAGAYGKCISDFIKYAVCFDARRQTVVKIYKDEMDFSYRSSIFSKKPLYILSAEIGFKRGEADEIEKRLSEILQRRIASQPLNQKSLGSVFKREGDTPISRLIDLAGLKGRRVGNAQISPKHAGFIVNLGGACAEDYLGIIEIIKTTLYEKYSIIPKEEIEIIK